MSVIGNFVVPVEEKITQSAEQFRMRLVPHLIKGVS